ncbi:helix-turn-helix domain-containing protein [Labrys portucalensis]|uniref:Helix-turn-helix domain-containing protein n=1 Tax=Labrys neptuniae TaxID=376174 RepID=A0ABV6Z9D9_9HYPH
MTLSDFITANNLTDSAFARQINVSRQALARYKAGDRRPEWHVIARIVEATQGNVTANDFLKLPIKSPASHTSKTEAAA